MEVFLGCLGILALIPILLFYNAFSWGFVCSKFYLWFIVSVIPGVPQFTVLQFIGFMFFLLAIMPKHNHAEINEEHLKNKYQHFSTLMLAPWMCLLCGYLIYLFY